MQEYDFAITYIYIIIKKSLLSLNQYPISKERSISKLERLIYTKEVGVLSKPEQKL